MNNPFSFLSNLYSGNQSSKIQEMLKQESTKLEDVLDEDILAQDFKEGKTAVLNLFAK
jgi:hypothetical protein